MNGHDFPGQKVPSPSRIFVTLLLVIAAVEALIMFLLPLMMPSSTTGGALQSFADAFLLSALSAPFLWVLVAGPLRRSAMNEISRVRVVLENIVDAVINFDEQGRILALNPAAEKMFGYASEEIIGQPIIRLIPGMQAADLSPVNGKPLAPDTVCRLGREAAGCRKDGSCLPMDISVTRLLLDGRLTSIAIIDDMTGRKEAEAQAEEQRTLAGNLLQNHAVPTFVITPGHQVLIWNRACAELTGVPAEKVLGTNEAWRAFYDHKRPVLADFVIDGVRDGAPQYFEAFDSSCFIPEGLQAEGWYTGLNGRDRYLSCNAAPVRNAKGELLAVIETVEDSTERKRYEEQLEYQANHDELTSLPNRNLLTDRIRQALLIASRSGHEVALFFVNLDNLKLINDTLGHDIGDRLLKIVAERLAAAVRSGDTVARQGGDEFVIVIAQQAVSDNATPIAAKILEAISQPFSINEHELIVTCSIGISIFPRDGEDVQTLIKHADVAMYRAKEQGRNTFQFFTGEMNARSLARLTMEKYLRRALEHDELLVYYQPKVSLDSGRMTGMEALVRWQSPELGMVSPANFIPLAEETGLIEQIGEWVLRTACGQNKAWQDAGLPSLSVAVNLSARQFRQQEIATIVAQVLRETGLDPRWLELEITESLVMREVERVTDILNELKGMGVSLAMDDFGTGYSSLSYLKRFPFDKLKIDQSFVRDITSDPDSAAIATTVIAMAHSLRLKVIAEGVETAGQLNYLRSHSCDEMQGYYFSRPLPAVDFEGLLRSGQLLSLSADHEQGLEKTLLVVDDEKGVLASLKRLFLLEGYRVLTAESAEEGFELLANNRVMIVISDQRMPIMTGTEFLSRVKELYPNTVRIILSGHADLDSVTDAINHGAVYKFLHKPWDEDLLRDTIKAAFIFYESVAAAQVPARSKAPDSY